MLWGDKFLAVFAAPTFGKGDMGWRKRGSRCRQQSCLGLLHRQHMTVDLVPTHAQSYTVAVEGAFCVLTSLVAMQPPLSIAHSSTFAGGIICCQLTALGTAVPAVLAFAIFYGHHWYSFHCSATHSLNGIPLLSMVE